MSCFSPEWGRVGLPPILTAGCGIIKHLFLRYNNRDLTGYCVLLRPLLVEPKNSLCSRTRLVVHEDVPHQIWVGLGDVCLTTGRFLVQPAHNDKTAHPEVSGLMTELIKSRKKLKGRHING